MGPRELALVLLLVAAIASSTWVSRDARRRSVSPVLASALAIGALVSFPIGPLVYARFRHRVGPRS